MIKIFEKVVLIGASEKEIVAKIDTGACGTSIDRDLAMDMGFKKTGEKKAIRSALGRSCRDMINLKFILNGKKIDTKATLADRSRMKYKMIIGRRDLKGFKILVDE